jgi:hypothetical protein
MNVLLNCMIKEFLKKRIQSFFYKSKKLFNYFEVFCTKYNITDNTYDSFAANEKLVNKFYGECQNLVIGKISDTLLNEIKSNFCNEKCFSNSNFIFESGNDLHPVLSITNFDINTVNNLKKNLIIGNMHEYDYSNKTIKKLHDELREMFSHYINSPFIFVNTRIWKTKPNSENFGPNSFHTDGFMPGHLKIMIYVTPLNENFGTFLYKDITGKIHNIANKAKGTAILFKNSDILHSGNPGKSFERISIETTLMRSIINGNQNWPGHWFGRHFKHPKQIEMINK